MFMSPQAVATATEPSPRSAALAASWLCLAPALLLALFPGRLLALM
jgi:hypothetical protein